VNTRGRLISGLVTTVMALAGFVTAGALPAAAAPSTVDYVALGDSYAAGTALRDGTTCLQSDLGYPQQLSDSESRIDLTANVACSGATISEVASKQLSALERHTRLVTLTVGAANLGLSTVLTACTTGSPARCQAAILLAQGLLGDCADDENSLYRSLTALYTQVAGKAPGTRIVVTGYPLLFDSAAPDSPQAAINDATAELNCIIERAVAKSQATYANIYYVGVTKAFTGHAIGGKVKPPFINEPPSGEAFHPTADGYGAYADAIKTKLPVGWLNKQEPLA
jgi:lysophospholipase L1-like esterase